ncbi:hypothetical protein EV294_101310 [Paenibacillus sp. BK033]|uniref:hypothetical protein n=1 Tax=Paenibacillus sp. BK033 TaxID=2512133 RepID=UPI001050517A|nr:hypothetical protein [Paenibacillus sp. BK033]TCN00860.1 hypothetical protein EV294_101310 [Paenibacillus sp. BK033]
MTLQELNQALKSTGMPVAYNEFKGTAKTPVPAPPFITYQLAYNSDMIADNANYLDVGNYQIELYTDKKDPAAESLVQSKLKELQLPYSKVEVYLDDEKLFQIIYQVQLIGG